MQAAPNTSDAQNPGAQNPGAQNPGATNADSANNAKRPGAADTPAFENPFGMDDLLAFDDDALRYLMLQGPLAGRLNELALALRSDTSPDVATRISSALPQPLHGEFLQSVQKATVGSYDPAIRQARRTVLDAVFWELTYWKTPELYEALTEGEHIHPGVFRSLAPWLADATALDVGAGTGRATFACLRQGARRVIAVEPSPGLRQMLQRKAAALGVYDAPPDAAWVAPMPGRFDSLPLPDACVDISLSCSAFTADPAQGGEAGLAELRRVTRPGGHIVVIWPRPCDHDWYAAHGFAYTSVPAQTEMRVQFRSRRWALACAHRFYGRNAAVMRYLARHNTTELPLSLIGFNPPQDYFALSL